MKFSISRSIVLALALSCLSPVASAANLIADVMNSGGFPSPTLPTSNGTALYDNGEVVFYRNYLDARLNVAAVVAHLSSAQVQQLLTAGANLTEQPLVREAGPSCADGPYQSTTILNGSGQMVLISDKKECRAGHRADGTGAREASFLQSLNIIANYGQN